MRWTFIYFIKCIDAKYALYINVYTYVYFHNKHFFHINMSFWFFVTASSKWVKFIVEGINYIREKYLALIIWEIFSPKALTTPLT